MSKIGRNQPCPCGSGRKFKRCHGSFNQHDSLPEHAAMAEASHVQRQRQQGFGKPIISAEVAGYRSVAVKNRWFQSKKWRTFHDFLLEYITATLGSGWGNEELVKPLKERHPILVWYHYVCEHQKKYVKEPGVLYSAPMIGAVAAYMNLAYDLYALDHNAELQDKLVGRLRDKENFYGARYEVFVAAQLIRAGFTIEFENEDDRQTTHCEFTATYSSTGKQFSVEAARRESAKFRPGSQLMHALMKQANHERLVFIDINQPDDDVTSDVPEYLENAIRKLKAFEGKVVNGKKLPSAYLVITNTPWHHHLESQNTKAVGLMDGFQMPDFKRGRVEYPSLRAAIENREKHIEMNNLLRSMNEHTEIPITFDGDIPEFAFGKASIRLKIGDRYLVRGEDGSEREGLLTTATVLEAERCAYCALSFSDGSSAIYQWPLSEDEMTAWRRYPDTFFGQLLPTQKNITDPLDLYDFFLSGFRATSRERLLELMASAPDIEELKKLAENNLLSIYAERCANTVIARNTNKDSNIKGS